MWTAMAMGKVPKERWYKISSGSGKFREANGDQRPHQNLSNPLHQYKAEDSGMFPKRHFPGGGDSAYERGGDARRKFWIKLLKETDLGGAQAFFDP